MSTIDTGPDRGPILLPICWTLTSLSTTMVALRWYCRVNYQARVWWDDFWMTIALLFVWAQSITWTVYSHLGGTSYAPMSDHDIVTTAFLSWISQCWSMAALVFGKMAVAALILRLQSPAKWRTILLKVLCIIAVVWDLAEIILIFVQCSPSEALWNPEVHGKCWNPKIVTYNGIAVASYLAFMDLALAVIPVHMIWGLQMPMQRKIGLCFLLSTGVFAFAMAVLKADTIPADLKRNTDFVRTAVILFIFNSCEANAVIIAGCIPTIMGLFDKLHGRSPYPSSGPRSRLLLGKSGGGHTAPSQSYKLSGKGVNTASSFDDDDAGHSYHFIAGASKRDKTKVASTTIQVTRQFDVADEETGRLVQANMELAAAPSPHGKA